MSGASDDRVITDSGRSSSINLKKKITLVNGICLIVGGISGSGIFVSSKGVQIESGSPGLSLVIWSICGVFSLVGALCYAELGTTIVKSGASYAYILEAFGPMIGFVRLWASVLIIEPTVQAAIAITFSTYLVQPFFPTCDPPFLAVRLLAAACVCIIMFMNCWNVRYGTRIQDWFAYANVIALIVIIVTGLVYLGNGNTSLALSNPWRGTTTNVGNIALAMYSGLYAYGGWDTLNYMVEELQNPYENLPKAIYVSLPLVTVMYILTNVAYYAVLSPAELIASDAVAISFAAKTLGSAQWLIPIAVAMSTFGGLNSSMMTSSRLFYTGARERQLPDYFGMVSVSHFTPASSVILSCVLTLVYMCVENVFDLINYYSFMYWLTVGLSVFGQIYLRHVRPDMLRPLKVHISFPISFSLVCLFLVIAPFFSDTLESLVGVGVLLTGFPVYWFFIYLPKEKRPEIILTMSRACTEFCQKLYPVVTTETSRNYEAIPYEVVSTATNSKRCPDF